MTQPIDLDSEAARLLKEADWLWSDLMGVLAIWSFASKRAKSLS